MTFPPLDIAGQWPKLNEQLCDLVDLIPDEQMDWSPKPELYNFRGIVLHIAFARHNWMNRVASDGEPVPDVLREGQTKDGAKHHLRLSWRRVERFISDRTKLDLSYEVSYIQPPSTFTATGHWVAYHLLEHDIHHRADIFHYLALLGIEHPEVETP
jgi:uncharacterized damage-inducible protein DinB